MNSENDIEKKGIFIRLALCVIIFMITMYFSSFEPIREIALYIKLDFHLGLLPKEAFLIFGMISLVSISTYALFIAFKKIDIELFTVWVGIILYFLVMIFSIWITEAFK